MSACHERAFCLVAVDGSTIIGFVNGRTDVGDGLLPGMAGEIESLYVVPEAHGNKGARAQVTFGRPERERPDNTE